MRIVQLANERFNPSIQLRFVDQAWQFSSLRFLFIVGPPATDDKDGGADEKNSQDCDDYTRYRPARKIVGEIGGGIKGSLRGFGDVMGCVVFGEYGN